MGAISKIIFFIATPFNKRDEERFGVEELQGNGFGVEVWDFTPVLNPDRFVKHVPVDKTDLEEYYIFCSRQDIIASISKLAGTCLILNLINYGYESYFIYRAITRQRLAYCQYRYYFPVFELPKRGGFYKRLSNITLEKLIAYLFAAIPYQYLGVRPADILIAAGGNFSLPKIPMDGRTKIFWTHHYDYEIYLRESQKPAEIDSSMIVFLDQYFPSHPDAHSEFVLPPEEYYSLMRGFFDYLEKKYAVHIVIAAHPRSNYDAAPDCFGGRHTIFGKTAELVRKARFVILHDSASINYAVLFKKPLIFITTNRLQELRKGLIDYIAAMFGKRPLNLNDTFEVDLDRELAVDEAAYKKHKSVYIKKIGAPDIPTWQAFVDCLRNWKE